MEYLKIDGTIFLKQIFKGKKMNLWNGFMCSNGALTSAALSPRKDFACTHWMFRHQSKRVSVTVLTTGEVTNPSSNHYFSLSFNRDALNFHKP